MVRTPLNAAQPPLPSDVYPLLQVNPQLPDVQLAVLLAGTMQAAGSQVSLQPPLPSDVYPLLQVNPQVPALHVAVAWATVVVQVVLQLPQVWVLAKLGAMMSWGCLAWPLKSLAVTESCW